MTEKYSGLDFKTTEEIEVPDKIIDKVIGQEKGVEIVKKAAKQRRNVVLIGKPGTGKSMLGQALAEMLSKEKLVDILSLPNKIDENNPKVQVVPAGMGRKIRKTLLSQNKGDDTGNMMYILFIAVGIISIIYGILNYFVFSGESDVLQAANRVSFTFFITLFSIGVIAIWTLGKSVRNRMIKVLRPKILVDNSDKENAPFIDATGAHEGALLGDVRHDPFQSGGLGTPAHERVEAGAIHKANKGVLFIDEIATLRPESQVDLLTAMQEKKLSITGRSERSAGAMVKTDPVPCDFILVAAGNLKTIEKLHPAMRSRMRGYGYEVYMNDKIENTPKNRKRFAQFVAQEIEKEEGKIPHVTREGVVEIIKEALRRSGRKNKLTMKLRDIGGLIRIAGDIAIEKGDKVIDVKHIKEARELAGSLEKQIAEKYIEESRNYNIILNKGHHVGRVNGLAVMADSGIVMPIEATVTPSSKKGTSEIIATGQLGKIAKEAVKNVFAVIKKYKGKEMQGEYDTHIQFIMSYSGVEGDSASISIATAVISALEDIPVEQNIAMTGSLSVKGRVLPIGGVNAKVEAAIDADMKEIIVPKLNYEDIVPGLRDKIKIRKVENIGDVIKYALKSSKKTKSIVTKINKVIS